MNMSAALGYSCIYRSGTSPDSQQVFAITAEDSRNYAMKIDTAPSDDRLRNEFGVLEELFSYFQGKKHSKIVEPIYLSPGGQFHVTNFVDHKTAKQIIYLTSSQAQAGQAYRRAGQWLHELHNLKPARNERFWFNWMFEEIE